MLSLVRDAGSHEVEVSSGVHHGGQQAVSKARSPSRFSKEAPAGDAEQETLSLQTLAAAADSGVLLHCILTATSSIGRHQLVFNRGYLSAIPAYAASGGVCYYHAMHKRVVCVPVCKGTWHHLKL